MGVMNITKENFIEEVIRCDKTVLMDFWAPWCMPCRMLSPVVDEIAQEADDQLKVGKINIDEEPELAAEFGVMSIPTLLVLSDGKITASSVGLKHKEAVLELLEI